MTHATLLNILVVMAILLLVPSAFAQAGADELPQLKPGESLGKALGIATLPNPYNGARGGPPHLCTERTSVNLLRTHRPRFYRPDSRSTD